MVKKIRVGHTPDADDAFMFYAIEKELIPLGDFQIEHIIQDIEHLNKMAINHELEVTAISAHALAYISDYTILNSGGSFGKNYGPIIISKGKSIENITKGTIGIPGYMTSAYLLMSLALGNLNCKEFIFKDIPNAVLTDEVDYGLVIHETQITYKSQNLKKIFDLGSWWNQETNGLPVPLGINVASSKLLDRQTILKFDKLLQDSIKYSLNNLEKAVEFSSKYGREASKTVLTEFIKMYVNNFTYDMMNEGKQAISKLFTLSRERGILKKDVIPTYSF